MGSLSEFRPPQFSEDDAWLPPWLQQCDVQRLNVEGIDKDDITFEQRVEKLQLRLSDGESFRDEGGCNIGQLFLSGTVCSPSSFVQSADNVVQFHLCLLSDGNSEHTSLTTDACQTESLFPLLTIEKSPVYLGHKAINLNLIHSSGAINWSPTAELERSVHKNELLRHEENVNFPEVAPDAIELSIAASEALVINEVMKSDSSVKLSSASAILEASLQVKQARLEVCRDPFSGSIDEIDEIDDLSDLDDTTMGSAYKDAGIHFSELPGNELSVSQVKDTLDSECDKNLKIKKAGVSANNYGKSSDCSSIQKVEGVAENEIQLEKDFSTERVGGESCDSPKKVINNQAIVLGTDGVGYHNGLLGSIQARAEFGLSVLEERGNAVVAENNSDEANVSFSPITCHQDAGKQNPQNIMEERFHSRWFGGWTLNNERTYITTVKHDITPPFIGETSFFSESADVAPDGNSFVQNLDKGATIASQLSIHSENFPNSTKDGNLLSQDVVRSSSASLLDPLCSVVPCSISENIGSSPTINYDDKVSPTHFNITVEHTKDNLLGTSASDNELAQGERIDIPIASIKEPQRAYRKFTSLRNYSKLMYSHAKFSVKDSHQDRLFFPDSNSELAFREIPLTDCEETMKVGPYLPVFQKENSSDCPSLINGRKLRHFQASVSSIHNLAMENSSRTALPENNFDWPPHENLEWAPLKSKKQTAEEFPASKRVRFSEKESKPPESKKLQEVQTASNTCRSSGTAKRSIQSTSHLESRSQHLKRSIKNHLDKEKKRLIFQNMEFVLTGFPHQKEKEIEGLIRKYGGIVLSQIPSTNFKRKRSSRLKSQILPIVICLKKIQSLKFLYGCAVNAFVLKVNWLVDSIAAGVVLPHSKYRVLSRDIDRMHAQVYTAMNYDCNSLVFNNLGLMLHGKTKNFTNIATAIKHGGGQVFKTLHKLVQSLEAGKISKGVVVSDDENSASRHLKHCALEQNIPMTSVYWIIRCLYAGKLIPTKEINSFVRLPAVKLHRCRDSKQLSQEI